MDILLNLLKIPRKYKISRGPLSKYKKFKNLWNNIKLFLFLYKNNNRYVDTSLMKCFKYKNFSYLKEIQIDFIRKTIKISKYINNHIKKSKKQIVLVHLTCIRGLILHSNILIIDKLLNTIARIEPHGSKVKLYPFVIYKNILQKHFKNYNILPLDVNNTVIGLQEIADSYTGLCITWCIFISDLYIRLKYYYNSYNVLLILKYFSIFLIKYKNTIQLSILILKYNTYLMNYVINYI